jgi:hypothetical protein
MVGRPDAVFRTEARGVPVGVLLRGGRRRPEEQGEAEGGQGRATVHLELLQATGRSAGRIGASQYRSKIASANSRKQVRACSMAGSSVTSRQVSGTKASVPA